MSGFAITVEGRRSALRQQLQDWLERTSLRPPIPLALTLDVVDLLPVPEDPREPFEQPGIEVRSGPPTNDLSILWTVAPALAVLPRDACQVRVTLSGGAARQMDTCLETFFPVVLALLLRRAGWHHVHGATAIDPSGRGWLLAGNAHSGKSTTVALMASQGWSVGSDDLAFLTWDGLRATVRNPSVPIALRPDTRHHFERAVGDHLARRNKTAFRPEDLGGTWVETVTPDLLVFPTVGTTTTIAHRVGPRDALAELVRWSALVVLERDLAQAHLELLTTLATQARSYRVTLGTDLFRYPERLAGLIP